MPEKRRIAITGGSGNIGSACVESFTERGWDVLRLDRNPAPCGQFAEHRDCLATAQFLEAAAGDQLLRLHEELDL
ncbi:MAG TPA: NAD-dependent epimerase/dehydratase family protein, partial [Tepidisphaeraceae bacterium]|nr:NAD-dependent epimerase/dehydratase family protein [Tepidisphaeraceae bacterium]